MVDDLVVRDITDEQWAAVWRHAEMWRGAKNFGGTIADALLQLKAQLAAMTADLSATNKMLGNITLELVEVEERLATMTAERDEWKRRAADFEARWMNADEVAKEVLGKLAAMTTERDEALSNSREWKAQIEMMADHHKVQLTASEAALHKYGRHLPNCHYEPGNPASCTCGFAAHAEETRGG